MLEYRLATLISSSIYQTIGQAYEDMQTQNQHLQQQVVGRDDYNIKVFCNYFPLSSIIQASKSTVMVDFEVGQRRLLFSCNFFF